MNFPGSPTIGDTYSLGTKTWKWNGVAWDLLSTGLTSSNVVTALGYTPLNKAGDTMTGNLAFSGTGLRINGDFSNATMSSRTLFQSSTTNGNTQVGALPNGTAVNSAWFTYNNSDPTNASTGILRINGSEVALISGITGTGTYLPMVFLTNNLERGRFDTAGNWGVGTSAPKVRAQFSAGSAQNAPTLGTAQGIAYFSNNDAAYGLLIGNSAVTGAAWLQAQRTDTTATAYDLLLNPAGGNVGIGTSSPAAKLDVRGSSPELYVAQSGTSNGVSLAWNNADGSARINTLGGNYDIKFLTNNTERFRFGASGQFGIGGGNFGTSGQVLTSQGSGAAPIWANAGSGSSQWTTSGSNIYYNTGNVSVGATTAGARFDVDRPSNFAGGVSAVASNPQFAITNSYQYGYPTGMLFRAVLQSGGSIVNNASIWAEWSSDNNAYLGFATTGSGTLTERARINSSGNLLVGTTSQLATNLLHTITRQQIPVSNSTAWADQMSPLVVYGNFGDGGGSQQQSSALTVVGWSSFGTPGAIMRGWWSTNGPNLGTPTLQYQVASNGNVTNTNNSYGSLSDARLKENITDATPKLENLNKLRVVNFNLKADPEKQKQIGLIAQEVEEVFPGLVETDGEGNKSVKYSVLVPMLLKALQEQQAIITTLTERITALEGNSTVH